MPTVGLVELPAFKLIDEDGLNWTALRHHEPLGSKQILGAQLEHTGFDVELVNLKAIGYENDIGVVDWASHRLTKVAVGRSWTELSPRDVDVWGLTVNYLQERDVACSIIKHLKQGGGRVVVGGSDAYAEPEPYLTAGADAVVKDKSGAANVAVLNWIAGNGTPADEELPGVALPDGRSFPPQRPPMSPQDWPLPRNWLVRDTQGTDYWEAPIPESLKPIGSVMLDIGCDRRCDFCETPLYSLGYRPMTPRRATDWLRAQADAGARSVIILSDQFLGRVLWQGGREDVLEIMSAARELALPVLWGNGIELRKATLGRSFPRSDASPDLDLVQSVWGWDGRVGCAQAYIPAERPLSGTDAYAKLLPWKQHCEMMQAIVSAGVPDINYGVIVGLADDSADTLKHLTEEIGILKDSLKHINPFLKFRITPYAIRPLPGTPQTATLKNDGLIRFDDPAILGGFWTACADTRHLSYRQVSEWQATLVHDLSDPEDDFQGITALTRSESLQL